MICEVREYDAREGGTLRVSRTYTSHLGAGKTDARTDTYRGYFFKLIPNELIVEVDEFETPDPQMQGQMTITISLVDIPGGTELRAVHAGLPHGISPDDNELGWEMSLPKLAKLVES